MPLTLLLILDKSTIHLKIYFKLLLNISLRYKLNGYKIQLSTKRESEMKQYILSKLTNFMWYIADGDDGLKAELEEIGPLGVIAIAVTLSVACSLLLTLWVIL
jgi:hypothetical protein